MKCIFLSAEPVASISGFVKVHGMVCKDHQPFYYNTPQIKNYKHLPTIIFQNSETISVLTLKIYYCI